jgi:FkbM family methyltransferase
MKRREATLRTYWAEALRHLKRAAIGRRTLQIGPRKFAVAYEARPHRHAANSADFSVLHSFASGARCVLDIGGHLGLSALAMASAAASDARIFVFEPSEYSCLVAIENARLNDFDSIEIVNCLVGGGDQRVVPFHWNYGSDRSSVKSDGDGGSLTFGKATITVDEFVAQRGIAPDAIKIDVEGAELDVLDGMQQTLRQFRPRVIVEVHVWSGHPLESQLHEICKRAAVVNYSVIDIVTKQAVTDPSAYSGAPVSRVISSPARVLLSPDGPIIPSWLFSVDTSNL